MNVEKLHKLAADLNEEDKSKKITKGFQLVISSLQNIINTPQQPALQNELTSQLNSLYELLGDSIVNELSPAWYQLLVELGIDDVFGDKLSQTIRGIIERNGITPASAKEELAGLAGKLKNTIGSFNQLTAGLKTFNIGFDELGEGECEIGILIPRVFIDNSFESLKDEIGELNFILNIFSEFFSGEKKTYELRTLSTTDPLITVGTSIVIAAGIAKCIGYVIDNYKKLLEIKELKRKLKEQDVPDGYLQGIEEHCNDYMAKKIEELTTELNKTHNAIEDKHRKNEILNGIRISLNKIANRIDRGFNFEVRVNEPESPETDDENENIGETTETAFYNEITSASKAMQFLKAEGNPILNLPEGTKKNK